MEFIKKDPKVLLLSGKYEHGKDTLAQYIKNEYEKKGKLVLILSFGFYIKEYAKKITDWNEEDSNKPRELLQAIGSELIRKQISEYFFVNKLIEDIKVYSYFFDIIVVPDCRFKIEIETLKTKLNKVDAIKIDRLDYINTNIDENKIDTDLEDYEYFDYIINNDSTLEVLKQKVHLLVEEVNNES